MSELAEEGWRELVSVLDVVCFFILYFGVVDLDLTTMSVYIWVCWIVAFCSIF